MDKILQFYVLGVQMSLWRIVQSLLNRGRNDAKVAINKNTAENPLHKYVEQTHWNKLQQNSKIIRNRDHDIIINSGLQYEDNVQHTGDAILLFQAFFRLNQPHHEQIKRRIADKFVHTNILDGFATVDRQYLLDLAAITLQATFWESSKNDKIHQLTNEWPNSEGVNPLLTTLFRVEKQNQNIENSKNIPTKEMRLNTYNNIRFTASSETKPSVSEIANLFTNDLLLKKITVGDYQFYFYKSDVDTFCRKHKILNVKVSDASNSYFYLSHMEGKDNSPLTNVSHDADVIKLYHWRGFVTHLKLEDLSFIKQKFEK